MRRLNPVERKIAGSYKANSGVCKNCREYCRQKELELHGRLSFFNAREKFRRNQYRVVFVGKNTWYDEQDVEGLEYLGMSGFKDCRSDGALMFLTRRSRFWGFIQDVARQLYPDEENETGLLDHISITNLTKCNTSRGYQDTTPDYLTENCVNIFEGESNKPGCSAVR